MGNVGIVLMLICNFAIDQAEVDKAMETIRGIYNEEITIPTHAKPTEGFSPAGLIAYQKEIDVDFGRDDIIVGDVPNETLNIAGYWYNEGDIIIVNDGVLNVKNADFNLDGDISILNQGEAFFDSSDVNFIQHHIYHHIIVVSDSGYCSMSNLNTTFSGHPFNVSIMVAGSIDMQNCYHKDWITAVVQGDANATLRDVTGYTGEWLFDGDCDAQFKQVEELLTWYFLPDGSVIDFDFPEEDTIYGFYIDSTLANVSGIGYHVEIDSCTQCMWAAIPMKGCDAIIRDSELRVTGIMFQGADTFDVSGLVNGLHYDDWVLPVGDRTYHLINTTVNTWNLYPFDSTTVDLSKSIFGELCGFASSYSTIMNAFCDGSGGHLEASGHGATLLVYLSSIFADVITKEYGLCVLAACSMPYGRIWATGSSIMIIVNTQFPEDPIPSDTSLVFVASVTAPSSAYTEDTVGIYGSAWIDRGPHQPLDFEYYQMFYRQMGDSQWIEMGDSQFVEVRRDTLDYWITVGLAEGDYEVRLNLKDTAGDSIEALKAITLRQIGVAEEVSTAVDKRTILIKRLGKRLFLIETMQGISDIYIYDAVGRQVHMFNNKTYWRAPSSGIYYLKDREDKITKKLVVF